MRALRLLLSALAGAAALAAVAWTGITWDSSRLPSSFNVMEPGTADYGGSPGSGHAGHDHGTSILAFHGPTNGTPDAHVRLVARQAEIRLGSGRTGERPHVRRLSPRPGDSRAARRLRRGDARQRGHRGRVSTHWHGVDVPNAEDGVAGVTQDAVPVGGRHVYRFRAGQTGTYWYHSHQRSADQVERGLYGAFVVLPREAAGDGTDLAVLSHTLAGIPLLGGSDTAETRRVAPGTPVRLRLVNSDNVARRFALAGTPFRVAAIDGGDIARPQAVQDRSLDVAAGGRYDVVFTMPSRALSLLVRGRRVGIAFSLDGASGLAEARFGPVLHPTAYGAGMQGAVEPGARLRPGLRRGHGPPAGPSSPAACGSVVAVDDQRRVLPADAVARRRPRRAREDHLREQLGRRPPDAPARASHGRARPRRSSRRDALARRHAERPPRGALDVAVRAGNPGLWMLHCHNLDHASRGLTTHPVYEGVFTPFEIGEATPNQPE